MSTHSSTVRTVRDLYADCGVTYPTKPHKRGSGDVAARTVDWVQAWDSLTAHFRIVRPGRVDPPMSTTRAEPQGGSE